MNIDGHLIADEVEAVCQPTDASRRLPASERLAISDHLAGCAACRKLVAAARIPSNDQRRLAADAQALAAAWQEASREEDLQPFAQFLTTFPAEHFEPGGTLPTRAATPRTDGERHAVMPSGRWWVRLFSPPFLLTGGVAVLAAAAALVTFALLERKSVERSGGALAPLLQDGSVVVAADGRLHADSNLPPGLRLAIVTAIAQRSLRPPAETLGILRGETESPATTTVGEPSALSAPFPLLPPSGTIVENERPLLQWTGVPGSADYQVEITLPAEGEKLLSPRLPVSRTNWQPESPLERGRIYHWRVMVSTPLGPLPTPEGARSLTSSFKVLGTADEEELRQLRAMPKVSHLALAVTCARLGLLDEAKAELGTLHAANPHSTLPLELSNSLK